MPVNNEAELVKLLNKNAVLRTLLRYEMGLLSAIEGAAAVGLDDANEFQWLRATAFTSLRQTRLDAGRPPGGPHRP